MGTRKQPLTVAGIAHVRVVTVDAGASTSPELGAVCVRGGHRMVVDDVGDTLGMRDRVDEGNSDSGGCGSEEGRDDGELHGG
jgi:hypothetical protein